MMNRKFEKCYNQYTNAKLKLINYLMIYQKLAWLNHALPRGLEDRIKYLDNRKVKFGVNRRRGALGISPKRPDHHDKCVVAASRKTSRVWIRANPKYLY